LLGAEVRMLTRLFDEFYKLFFDINPSGKRLFEQSSITEQSQSLVKMLSMVIKSIDNNTFIIDKIQRLGARHAIYGVKPTDYIAFSNTMCSTFEAVLGKDDFDNETRDAWFKVMMEISSMMQEAGEKMKKEVLSGVFWRKLGHNSKWKKSLVVVTLDNMYIYRDEKNTKIRSTYPLLDVNDIDENEAFMNDAPTDHGLLIKLRDFYLDVYFCLDKKPDVNNWVEEINWRTQALQRVYKEREDDDISSQSSESSSSLISEDLLGSVRKKVTKKRRKSRNSRSSEKITQKQQ